MFIYEITDNYKFIGNDKMGYYEFRTNDMFVSYKGEIKEKKFNGYGELVMKNRIVYKGEFINGKMNGKGKIYYKEKLLFEDTFINDIPQKNILFNKDKKYIKYIGTIKNIKILNNDGNVLYFGEHKDCRKHGYGILYTNNGDVRYRGYFKDDIYEGTGIEYCSQLYYVSNYNNGKKNGYTEVFMKLPETKNMTINKPILTYNGEYKNNMKHGIGTSYYTSIFNSRKKKYEGEWLNGYEHGSGKKYFSNPHVLIYNGMFQYGEYNGFGVKYNLLGHKVYEGEFKNGKYNGFGHYYKLLEDSNKYGRLGYINYQKGIFVNNDSHLKLNDIIKFSYEGEFKDGELTGSGIVYDNIGNEIFNGWIAKMHLRKLERYA